MSLIVEVSFAHERGALAGTFERVPDADATVIRETSTGPAQRTYFLRFEHDRPEAVREALEADETVRSVSEISASDRGQVLGIEFTDGTRMLNSVVTDQGGFVLHARRVTAGASQFDWRERWLLPDHESLYGVWQRARDQGFEFEVLDFQSLDGELSEYSFARALTPEQREALALAHERGYFTEPRETSLEELADELELSPSAAAGRLKRGLKLLIEEALVVSEPET